MSHKLLSNASLHEALFVLDGVSAHSCRQSGCWHCGARLHVSNYVRKPRGVPEPFQSFYEKRFSFTCAQCRCRCTPPSVRFFGQLRFVAGIPVLIAALMRGPSDRRCRQLERCFGVRLSASTWQRWRRWWRQQFLFTPFWLQSRGHFAQPEQLGCLPAGLLRAFPGRLVERLWQVLHFLSPLTGGALRAV
ncbi:MAG: hypothetical protein EA370_16360 [Wenzhouxiangella sp.]|nr:MAG: hypothetical protein EA370_16360 [Wenzhouxiangella sp.]